MAPATFSLSITRHHAWFWPFTGCMPMDKGRKLHWNEPENMFKQHPSIKPAICNLPLGIVRHCSALSYSTIFCLACAVFAPLDWVNLNVCHSWLSVTLVLLLEVGVSLFNSCHVPEEVQKMLTSVPPPQRLAVSWGIFQGQAEPHSYSCVVIKCKRLPIGL